ncbi:MAG: ATP-binding protein [Marmoricola sp.]
MTTRTAQDELGASSTDGRTFQARGMTGTEVPGDLVVIRASAGPPALGQLLGARADNGVMLRAGAILGTLGPDGAVELGTVSPFVGASIEGATRDVWAALERKRAADMAVGDTRAGRALLSSSAFNRHTFLCGQSGSGKSYAMGVLLEQLLIDTDLPMMILDPNGDFVGLGTTLATAEEQERGRLEAAEVRVFRRAAGEGERLLRARFATMSVEAKAAVLQLDPLADRTEYHVLVELGDQLATRPAGEVISELLASEDDDMRSLAQRIENLGVLRWDVWAGDDASLLEELEPRPRATVIDLGGFDHPREPLVVAMELLDHLWARRHQREPVLLVIDEAHNICPSNPTDPLAVATTARIIQLANEGRKYGIWMLLCSQRPSRIHESVLAQCDNLALMRMNSPGDLSQLERVFGFAPAEMLRAAPGFRKGECLMAGTFAPAPAFVQVRARRTREGGSDVAVPRRPS